jgi:tetratricopeptide (TPR) repeat protein
LQVLRTLAPNSTATFELTVRLANKRNVQQAARDQLLKVIAPIVASKQLNEQQHQVLLMFAGLLIDLKDLDSAEKIYRDLAQRDPNKWNALAVFLGMYRGVDRCFEYLNQVYQPERIDAILSVALAVVREKRDQIVEKYDPEIQRWLEQGLRENPDSIALLLAKADLYDIQKKYDESAAVYRKLLDKPELTGLRRAMVLNNLSFLMALADSAAVDGNVDPLKLVNEAAEILGPNSDILDTRAVVWNSRGKFKEAIADLTDAVTDTPTASKYFHLAQAHWGAGQKSDALEAWKRAEELGLSRESLNRMEYDKYEQLKRQIDQLRGGTSVTQTELQRRAG